MRSRVRAITNPQEAARKVTNAMNDGRLRDAWRLVEGYRSFLGNLDARSLLIFGAACATSKRPALARLHEELWEEAKVAAGYTPAMYSNVLCWLSIILSKSGQTDKAWPLLANNAELLRVEHPQGLSLAVVTLAKAPGGTAFAKRLRAQLV